MKSTVATGAVSVAIGAVLGAIVVTAGTFALTQSNRPNIDRSGDADYSIMHSVDYGRTVQVQ